MSIDVAQPAPRPAYLGQATAVEQARAVAQVQAAVLVAQQAPRSIAHAIGQMRESCAQRGLAERAFFRFPRSDKTVSGPSVHLARELARCWRNIDYGIAELRRDDIAGESEMIAHAWDLEANTRVTSTFIVPHARDTKTGRKQLAELRDIYENNANAGARRVRECIFAVLPPWYVEEAKDLCSQTITGGGGKPLGQRVADAIALFDRAGIVVDRLEQKIGAPAGQWTEWDVAQLGVIYRSIQHGEVQADDEFPPRRVTAAEIAEQAAAGAAQSAATPPAGQDKAQAENGSDAPTQPEPDAEEADQMSGRRATPPGAGHSLTRVSRGGDPGPQEPAVSQAAAEAGEAASPDPASPATRGSQPEVVKVTTPDPRMTKTQWAQLRTIAKALHRDPLELAREIIGRDMPTENALPRADAQQVIDWGNAELAESGDDR
jgi:hypothetical protein